MNKLSLSSTISVTKEAVHCSIEEEVVILGLKNGIYYGLNPVGAFVWNMIQKPKKVEEIRDTILEEYNVSEEECEADLIELLRELLEHSLIEVANDQDS